jgi:hypothetical protein
MVARFFKGYASQEVTRPREVATDPTFLTGLTLLQPAAILKLLELGGENCVNLIVSKT